MPYKKALIFNDLHIPFHCKPAIKIVFAVGRDLSPDLVIVNGDALDMWEISNFIKHPLRRRQRNLVEEIRQGREWFHSLRKRFPNAKIKYIMGNHEYRWIKYLASHAQELAGLRGLSLEEQLDCEELKIDVVNSGNRESSFLWGKLLIGHFDRVNKHSAYTAKNLLEDKGISLIQAHTHRGGVSYKREWSRDIVAFENFCLCNRNPEYVDRPNWQLGFCIVYKDDNSDLFYVEPHPITEIERGAKVEYRTWFNGEIYCG